VIPHAILRKYKIPFHIRHFFKKIEFEYSLQLRDDIVETEREERTERGERRERERERERERIKEFIHTTIGLV